MKRLTLLAAALVMVLGMAASAAAAPEVSISGNLLVNAIWGDNWNFIDDSQPAAGDNTEGFKVYERADLYFTITANENLKGVLGLRSDRGEWGKGVFADGTPGGGVSDSTQNGNGNAALGIREAYIDFNWPGTSVNVRAGIQNVGLPAAVGGGSIIQNEKMGAVMVTTQFTDNVGLLAGWGRVANARANSLWDFDGDGVSDYAASGNRTSEIDAAILALPLTFEAFNMTPYFAYGIAGDNANQTAGTMALNGTAGGGLDSVWWLGTDFTLNLFDPFILKADLVYGKANGRDNAPDRSGWLGDIALEYTGWDFMTPELFFVYTSGEDGNASHGDGDSERLPTLAGDWAVGSFFFGGGSVTGDDLSSEANQNGFWTVGLSLKDIQSFTEGLTHTAHILYAQGTNDKDSIVTNNLYASNSMLYGRSLTTEESIWEVDFNTDYQIYDELTLYNQIGYVSLDADDSNLRRGALFDGGDAWKFGLGVVYQF